VPQNPVIDPLEDLENHDPIMETKTGKIKDWEAPIIKYIKYKNIWLCHPAYYVNPKAMKQNDYIASEELKITFLL
jgi:hypothetical protein